MCTPRQTHVNELLCYAVHKQGKLPANALKSILANFYTLEHAITAKEALVGFIDSLSISKWPHPSTRRRKESTGAAGDIKQTDNKICLEIDDIASLY